MVRISICQRTAYSLDLVHRKVSATSDLHATSRAENVVITRVPEGIAGGAPGSYPEAPWKVKADSALSVAARGVAERITVPTQSCKTSARSHLPG